MATISKSKTFTDGSIPVANDFNQNFDTIYNEFNGSIDNTNIKSNAAIAGTKLAANAVSKINTAERAKTNFDVAGTTFVDVPDLSTTFTTQASSDLLIFVTIGLCRVVSAGTRMAFTLNIDGSDVDTSINDAMAHLGGNSHPAGVYAPVSFHHYVSSVSSGSHTIKVRAATTGSGDAGDIGGNVSRHRITVLELKR